MKKRLLAMVATVAIVATALAGCGSKTEDKSTKDSGTKTETTSSAKVGMATDEGGINDKSFNEAANKGLMKAKDELKLNPKVLESKTNADYEPYLKQLSKDNDLVFGIGYKFKTAMENVSKDNADKKYAIVDDVVDAPNVMSINFKEEDGSFLMGVIAGKTTKTNKVGFIGGIDGPLINKFEAGFIAGVASVNPEAAKALMPKDGKSGTNVRYAGSFSDVAAGGEIAKALYNDGCDVIYHAAGGVGVGLLNTAKSLRDQGKDVWAIGVDQDQSLTMPENASAILSSMIKKVDVAVYDVTKKFSEGKFEAGKKVYGFEEGGIDMAETTSKNTAKDVIDLANKYKEAIKSKKFTVPATREDLEKFKAPTLE
ncbi:BMP family lipoprotein [Clostridium cellulovorans]|uniref:Basic membrane lipoprotein n=1 Tax=Clostridium cellulovorans (strain ATCC 35296 / DSM 3052 / OCM 3 / 743B) TaxID=573061 RepID=D9SRW5_CLOC7|nr:basic membrane lipoprotein [Clostridium cellulovorans 743B]